MHFLLVSPSHLGLYSAEQISLVLYAAKRKVHTCTSILKVLF